MAPAHHAVAATVATAAGFLLGVTFAPLHYRHLPEREFGGVGEITSGYRRPSGNVARWPWLCSLKRMPQACQRRKHHRRREELGRRRYRARRIGDIMSHELEAILAEGASNWTAVLRTSTVAAGARNVFVADEYDSDVACQRATGVVPGGDAAKMLKWLGSEAGLSAALGAPTKKLGVVERFPDWQVCRRGNETSPSRRIGADRGDAAGRDADIPRGGSPSVVAASAERPRGGRGVAATRLRLVRGIIRTTSRAGGAAARSTSSNSG